MHFKATVKQEKEHDLNGKKFNDFISEKNVTNSKSDNKIEQKNSISDDPLKERLKELILYKERFSNNDSNNDVNSGKIDWKKFDNNTKTTLNSSDKKIEQENLISHDELKERFKNLTSNNDSTNNVNSEKIDSENFEQIDWENFEQID